MAVSQIKVGALISYVTVGINILLGLIYTPWMISVIGQAEYGLYALAASVIGIFVMDFGIGAAVSRFLSMYYAKGENEKANEFLGAAYKAYLVLAGVIAVALIVVYFLIDVIYASLTPDEVELFKSLYIVCALYSVFSVPFLAQNNVLLSNERFIAMKMCGLLNKVLVVAVTAIALLMGYGVFAVVTVNAACNVFFILVRIVLIRRLTPSRANFKKTRKGLIKEFVAFSGWVTVSQLCSRSNYLLMPSVLGAVSGSVEITLFSLASTIEGYVWNIADAIGGLFLPRVSQLLLKESSAQDITDLMIKVGRLQVYIVGAIYVCFLSMGSAFVGLWLGSGYHAVWICACIIVFPSMITVPQQIGGTAMTASNKVKYLAMANIALAVVTVVAGIPLAYCFGAVGAAVAVAIGVLVNRAIVDVFFVRLLNLGLGRFFREAYLKWFLPATISFAVAIAVQAAFPIASWPMFVTEAAVFVVTYAVANWFLAFNSYEKSLFIAPLRKVFRR